MVVQKGHTVSRPQVAVDVIVLVAVLVEGLSLVIVIVVDVPEVRSAGQGAISMLLELRLNVQEAKKISMWTRQFNLKKAGSMEIKELTASFSTPSAML